MTADLMAFLRARLDDEEGRTSLISSGGYQPPRWTAHRPPDDYVEGSLAEIRQYDLPIGASADEEPEVAVAGYMAWGRNEDQHVVRWCPDRVAREIKAKRRILDECAEILATSSHWTTVESCDEVDAILAEHVVRALALPYSEHPEYREEWRP